MLPCTSAPACAHRLLRRQQRQLALRGRPARGRRHAVRLQERPARRVHRGRRRVRVRLQDRSSVQGSISVPASVTTSDGVTLPVRSRTRGERPRRVLCLHAMMTDGRYFGARRDNGVRPRARRRRLRRRLPRPRPVAAARRRRATTGASTTSSSATCPALVDATRPDAIIGHSLGGLVTLAALGTGRIAPPRALVLGATSVWLGGDSRSARDHGRVSRRHGAVRQGADPRAARRHGRRVEELRRAAHRLAAQRALAVRAGVDYLAALETITVPALAITGAGDWMCKPDDAAAIARRIRARSCASSVARTATRSIRITSSCSRGPSW